MTREIGPLAAALVLTVLAYLGLSLSPEDPLRSTLVLLPLMVTALLGIGRWARDRGGHPTPRSVAVTEAALLSLLILVCLGRYQLGLGDVGLIDRVLVGAFFVLLGHRVGWLIYALLGALGSEIPRSPPSPFFALPFVLYLAILPWTTTQRPPDGDAPHYLLLTHSLAFDFDTNLQNNYTQGDSLQFMDLRLTPQPGDPQGAEGELYSRHNLLLPLILAPFYRLAGLFGVLVAMAAITAVTAWLTLALARFYDPGLPCEAILAWATLAFTAPFLLFSYQVWVEIPAALLVVVSMLQIQRLRQEEPITVWNWVSLFGSVLLLPLLKIRFLLIAAPLATLAIWHASKRRRSGALLLLVSLLVLVGATLLFNQMTFDNPLKYHDIDGLRSYAQPAGQYLRGFIGLFFDCAFGLFANAPIWMLLLPALILTARQRHPALKDFALVFLPYLLLLSPRGEWFGAWSPPYRYGVVMLPLLTIWLIPLLRERRRAGARTLIVILLVGTLALTMFWLVIPGWTYNLAHGRSHVLDQLSTRTAADVARFFPSATRIRAATYIWPPVALVLTTLLWRWRGRPPFPNLMVWATAAALVVPTATLWSARHRVTRVVEFEDPWLSPDQGFVYPDLWVVYRPQFRGGWRLPSRTSMLLPAVPGGDVVDLQIDLLMKSRTGKPGRLEITDTDGTALADARIERVGEWTSLSFDGLPWTPDHSLTLAFQGPEGKRAENHSVILDRAILTWREDPASSR